MHTQHDTAQAILGRGADYVMTVKASMPTLYRQLKKLPWTAIPAVSAVSTDHGRRARRTIKAALAPPGDSWCRPPRRIREIRDDENDRAPAKRSDQEAATNGRRAG